MINRSPACAGRPRDNRCDKALPRSSGRAASSAAPHLSSPYGAGGRATGAPVLVVFVDDTACPWLRLLRRGFRHCFVLLHAGPQWLACEPLKDRIELDLLDLPQSSILPGSIGTRAIGCCSAGARRPVRGGGARPLL
jgi:hypothetical protein